LNSLFIKTMQYLFNLSSLHRVSNFHYNCVISLNWGKYSLFINITS